MKNALSLGTTRAHLFPSIDPVGMLLRLDARYRAARRCDELTAEQLNDVGLTRADFARLSRTVR